MRTPPIQDLILTADNSTSDLYPLRLGELDRPSFSIGIAASPRTLSSSTDKTAPKLASDFVLPALTLNLIGRKMLRQRTTSEPRSRLLDVNECELRE